MRNVPPFRSLKSTDLNHLDEILLAEEEMHGRVGRNRNQRRPARKILCDIVFLMGYITTKVEEAGKMADEITLTAVDDMFRVVADEFSESELRRSAQKKWITAVHELRRRNRLARRGNGGGHN